MKKIKILFPILLFVVIFSSVNIHCKKEVLTTIDTIKDIDVINIELLTKYEWKITQRVRINNTTGMHVDIVTPADDLGLDMQYKFCKDSSVYIYIDDKKYSGNWSYEDESNEKMLFLTIDNVEHKFDEVKSYYKIIKLTETGLILVDLESWSYKYSYYFYLKKIPLTN